MGRWHKATHTCASLLIPSQGSDVRKDYWKAELVQSIANITSEYNALMYGGNSITQVVSVSCTEQWWMKVQAPSF
jgi:hypothetical protein